MATTANGIYYRTQAEARPTDEAMALSLANSVDKAVGLVPVIPTSIGTNSGTASVAADGTVSFTSSSGIILDGVFTSAYRNYRVVFSTTVGDSNDGTLYIQFRAGGSLLTASYHKWQNIFAQSNSATVYSNYDNGSTQYIWLNSIYGNPQFTADIYNPQVSTTTTSMTYQSSGDVSGVYRYATGAGKYPANTAVDGFRIYTSVGTMSTGQVRVYGYR